MLIALLKHGQFIGHVGQFIELAFQCFKCCWRVNIIVPDLLLAVCNLMSLYASLFLEGRRGLLENLSRQAASWIPNTTSVFKLWSLHWALLNPSHENGKSMTQVQTYNRSRQEASETLEELQRATAKRQDSTNSYLSCTWQIWASWKSCKKKVFSGRHPLDILFALWNSKHEGKEYAEKRWFLVYMWMKTNTAHSPTRKFCGGASCFVLDCEDSLL